METGDGQHHTQAGHFHPSLDILELQFTDLGQTWPGSAWAARERRDRGIIVNKWTDTSLGSPGPDRGDQHR